MIAARTSAVMKRKEWIPQIPESQTRKLAERIKPVVEFPWFGKCYIWRVDLFSVAYTWAPRPLFWAWRLKPLCDITTYHSWSYYGFFKPSVAEVLSQIPAEHLDRVVAFEIVGRPVWAEDMTKDKESKVAFDAGYHVATTRLYVQE